MTPKIDSLAYSPYYQPMQPVDSITGYMPLSPVSPVDQLLSGGNVSFGGATSAKKLSLSEKYELSQAYAQEKAEIEKANKQIQDTKKSLKEGENADGSSTQSMSVKEYRKKTPWYKRLGRALGNGLSGLWKTAKSLAGFDKDGKWNPWKCLKNVAVVAAGVALTVVCPAAGPVLLYAGLAAGAVQIGKGIYKACKAETVEQLDNAYQDIGVGAATVLCSRAGLKGAASTANAAKVASQTSTTFANTGKAISWIKNPGQVIKYNAQRGALNFKGGKVNWDKTQLPKAENFKFWSRHSRKYNEAAANADKSWNKQMSDIEAQLADPNITAAKRAMLQEEKAILEFTKSTGSTFATKRSNYKALSEVDDAAKLQDIATKLTKGETVKVGRTEIAATEENITIVKNIMKRQELVEAAAKLSKGETVKLGGQTITATEENIAMVTNAAKRQQTLTAELGELITSKEAMMAARAKNPFKYGDEIKAYTGNDSGFYARMSAINPNKNPYLTAGGQLLKGSFYVTAPEFMAWSAVPKAPSALFYTVDQACYEPSYKEEGMLNILSPEAHYTLSAEDYQTTLTEINAQEEQVKSSLAANQKKFDSLNA